MKAASIHHSSAPVPVYVPAPVHTSAPTPVLASVHNTPPTHVPVHVAAPVHTAAPTPAQEWAAIRRWL